MINQGEISVKSAIAIVLIMFTATALSDNCKYSKLIEHKLDLSNSTSLSIVASAGDLDVKGGQESSEAMIRGKVCASKEKWLEDIEINIEAGESAGIVAVLPQDIARKGFWGMNYAYIDLEVDVPSSIRLDIKDSSGDIDLSDIGVATIKDSSGDIEINRSSGPIEIEDSSGDIEVDGLDHGLTIIADSSGDIDIDNIHDDVLIEADSSGDISITDVDGNVMIERDSSGDISARQVSGDFSVLRDGSGGISSRDIAGEIDIPENKM